MAQQLRVVIAPSGFKESLSAEQVAAAIAEGLTHIELGGLDPRLKQVRIDMACNIHNILR
jgi:glycerate kinase